MLLKLAIRNVLRHKRRTFLTAFMMVGGYILLSFSISLVEGAYGDTIKLFTDQYTGHVQIHNKSYIDKKNLYNTIKQPIQLEAQLSSETEIRSFSSRILSGALSFANKKTSGVEVIGVNWSKEENTTGATKRLEKGVWPNSSGKNEVVVGAKLFKSLKLKINDELILISQGADGSIANDIFLVKGVFKSGGRDDYRVYTDVESAQEFYSLYGQYHEYVISLKNFNLAKSFSDSLKVSSDLLVRPWQEVEVDFYRAMEVDKKGNRIGYIIITLVVALGVLNTVLMSILERTREFGVLIALGTSNGFIIKLILLEAQIISTMGIVIGFLFSYMINSYFSVHGISLGESFSYGGIVFDKMHAVITLTSFLFPAIVISGSTFLVSLYPCFRATSISPVEAMRDM